MRFSSTEIAPATGRYPPFRDFHGPAAASRGETPRRPRRGDPWHRLLPTLSGRSRRCDLSKLGLSGAFMVQDEDTRVVVVRNLHLRLASSGCRRAQGLEQSPSELNREEGFPNRVCL